MKKARKIVKRSGDPVEPHKTYPTCYVGSHVTSMIRDQEDESKDFRGRIYPSSLWRDNREPSTKRDALG